MRRSHGGAPLTLEFFHFGTHAANDRNHTDQYAGVIGSKTVFFQVVCAKGIGLSRRQDKVEGSHRDDLTQFRVSGTDECADGLFHAAQLCFFQSDETRIGSGWNCRFRARLWRSRWFAGYGSGELAMHEWSGT